jgi:molybdopterin-guanine dinucleotide biosynthesis protein A
MNSKGGEAPITFTAVLLAGGESRRMGRDKALIEFQGDPLWRRQLNLLRELRPDKIFVSARTLPTWLQDGHGLLIDDPPSRGPLSGLGKAIGVIETTHLIALAVDMPFMTSPEFGRLFGLLRPGRGVVPVIGDRAEPLAAIYPVEAAADFKAALLGMDYSIQTLVRKLVNIGKVVLCPVPDGRTNLYRSVNEPSDVPL